jgi:polyphosphate glucokinase
MPAPSERITAIDVGAGSIKVGVVGDDGTLLEVVHRVATPYPCWPARLVDVVADEVAARGLDRVGVGFPGDFEDGVVLEPGNLARPGGITTDVDPDIERAWQGFALETELRERSGRDVRVVNDATLAALGCADGHGVELVFTLGTGLGIALVVEGALVRIRDVGAEVFRDGRTYDQLIGEASRFVDEARWVVLLHDAVAGFVAEYHPDVVHVGGGNARRVDPSWFDDLGVRVVLNDNDDSLRGAAGLFREPFAGSWVARER